MKFLLDANLPFKLSYLLKEKGYDVVHTDDLPHKERTKDKEINEISVLQNRIVITKDFDFLDSHLITNIPDKLLLVTTGNITNKSLFEIFENNIEKVVELFKTYDFIELNNKNLIGHDK